MKRHARITGRKSSRGGAVATADVEKHANLSVAATALLQQRARAAAGYDRVRSSIEPHPGGVAPLSTWQRSFWLFEQLHRSAAVYNSAYRLRLDGDVDDAALERSIREIFRRHTVLRSRIEVERGMPSQRVLPLDRVLLPWLDFSGFASAERARLYREVAERLAFEPFDLLAGPFARASLIRMTGSERVILLTMHHIASDGWSASLFFQELAALYNALSSGRASPLPEPLMQYRDYAAWQDAELRSPASEADARYWIEHLSDAPPLLGLPTDRPRPADPDHAAATETLMLPGGLIEGLQELGLACNATVFMVLLAAFQVLLARLTGTDDIVTGIPTADRDRPGTQSVIGCFINVIPLRTRIDRDTTFRNLLGAVRSTALAGVAHQRFPFAQMVQRLHPERSANHSPVTQVQFNYRCNIPSPSLRFRALHAALERVDPVGSVDPFAMDITGAGEGLRCSAIYSTGLFDGSAIRRWLAHYRILLEGIVANPDSKVGKLPLLSAGERAQLIAIRPERQAAPDRAQCVHRLIEAQALRTPEAVAVLSGSDELTYAQLDRRANAVARKLAKSGVSPDSLVGVCLERSLDLVIALVAVFKAGGGYVPLDPALPRERLGYIATDSGARVFIASASTAPLIPGSDAQVLRLDDAWRAEEAAEAPYSSVTPENIAYVIYTSGSTGRPKGVAVEHRSLCNYLTWLQRHDPLGTTDTTLQRASISFDFSIMELLWPLIGGARLILAEPGRATDLDYLISLIEVKRITVLMCVPTLLGALLDKPEAKTRCAGLRRIYCGGESLSPGLVRRCLSRLAAATLYNLYGPTEATVCCSAWTCDGTEEHTVPIGFPIADSELYVLDAHSEPVPVGVTGELYIGGACVARGFIGRPELTRERFLANPFRAGSGERIYRTGDLVRRRPDGALEFLGRNDDQVKMRGVRIELGEIESVLATHADVAGCAVSVHRNATGDPHLVAYVVPRAGAGADVHALRPFLAERLPDVMVPSWFIALESLPLNPSGKVDRVRLPEPDLSTAQRRTLGAEDSLQAELIRIWEDVLGTSPIGITDDFFQLGGHSLLAMNMMDRVAREFDIEPPLQALFREPTVRGLAAAMIETDTAQDATEDGPVRRIQVGEPGRTPLFLFHGDLAGGGLYSRKLAQRIDHRLPVYVLPPHVPGDVRTIEAMAQDYLPHILEIWPGPYLLAGYCNGGIVALEVAQRLRTMGRSVDLLAVIDFGLNNARLKLLHHAIHATGRILGLNSATRDSIFLGLRERAMRFRAGQAWDVSRGRSVPTPLAALRFVVLEAQLLSRRIWRQLWGLPHETEWSAMEAARRALPDWKSRRDRLDFMARAVGVYIPRPYPGPITVVSSQTYVAGDREDPFRNWRAIAATVDGVVVSGDHFSILTEHIDDLASVFRTTLPDPGKVVEATNDRIPRPEQVPDIVTT